MTLTNPATLALLRTLLAATVAGGCGLVVLLLLLGPRGPIDTVQVHRDLEAQLLFAGVPRRPSLRDNPNLHECRSMRVPMRWGDTNPRD